MTHVFMAESRGFHLPPSIPHFILTCFFVLFSLLYNLVSPCPCLPQLYLTIHPSLPPSISSLDLAWYVFICLSHLIHPSAPDLLLLPSIPFFYFLLHPQLSFTSFLPPLVPHYHNQHSGFHSNSLSHSHTHTQSENHTWTASNVTFAHTQTHTHINACKQTGTCHCNQPHTCKPAHKHYSSVPLVPVSLGWHTHAHTQMRTHSDVITVSAESAVQRCESSKSYRLPSIIKSFLGIGQLTVSALRIVSLYFNQSCPPLQKGLQIAKWYWLAFIRPDEWLCRIQGSDLLCVHVCTLHGVFCVSEKLFSNLPLQRAKARATSHWQTCFKTI